MYTQCFWFQSEQTIIHQGSILLLQWKNKQKFQTQYVLKENVFLFSHPSDTSAFYSIKWNFSSFHERRKQRVNTWDETKNTFQTDLCKIILIHMSLLQCQKGSSDGSCGVPETLHYTEPCWAAAQHSHEGPCPTVPRRGWAAPCEHTFCLTLERDNDKKQFSIPNPSSYVHRASLILGGGRSKTHCCHPFSLPALCLWPSYMPNWILFPS